MKKKISSALAASLIVGQMQGVTFAENLADNHDADINKESISQETDAFNADKDLTEELKEEVSVESLEEDTIENSITDGSNYNPKGKLELDLNFALPIKHTTADKTNISVTIKSKSGEIETVRLGSDQKKNTTESGLLSTIEALSSKREALKPGENVLSFYHLTFENLELGIYSIEIAGDGYKTTTIDNIDVSDYSKRVLVGTSDNTIIIDDKGTDEESDDDKEYYPGVFLAGNIDADGLVTHTDYEALKNQIKSMASSAVKSSNKKFDLNRDGKIDITDLTYIHKNIDSEVKDAEAIDTDAIINPEAVDIELPETTKLDEGVDIKDVLKDNGSTVALKTASEAPVSEENPLSMTLNLAGKGRQVKTTEQIVIKAPSENAPTAGSIVIPGAGEFKFNESNVRSLNDDSK